MYHVDPSLMLDMSRESQPAEITLLLAELVLEMYSDLLFKEKKKYFYNLKKIKINSHVR